MTRSLAATSWFRRLAEYDAFPAFSARVRRTFLTPLGILLLSAAMAILAGLAIHPRVFALAGGLLVVAAAGVCWPWLTVRGARAVVRFDRARATEGESVGATAEITNHLPWPAWGLVVRDEKADQSVRLPSVPGRSRASCGWGFVPRLRGEYPLSPPRVATDFPFGLWQAGRAAATDQPLIVWPRTFPVGPVPVVEGDEVVEGNVTRNKVGSTGDVLGVRPYRRGDSPRRIHWAQSAKHDRLVVCELQSYSRPVVLIVLDADPAVHTPGTDGSREWAIRVAASLAKGWLEAGAQVGAVWGDVFIPPRAGGAHATQILDALARLPDQARPLAEVLAAAPVRSVRSGVKVVVTSDAGLAAGRGCTRDIRWVVLHRDGFGGSRDESSGHTCDEAPPRPHPHVWLSLRTAADIARQLRSGTAEASHGT